MQEDFEEGKDYKINRTDFVIRFRNGSEIFAVSWADRLYKKFRSLKISMLVIEEIVENDEEDFEAFKQLSARLRRLPHVKDNLLIAATNPDAPGHWVYKYFIEPNTHSQHAFKYVFYSNTEQNPFLDASYITQLKETMTQKEAERYLEGRWNELKGEVIYYEYDSATNYLKDHDYTPNPAYPIGITFDFNIGDGKPMSAIMFQHIDKTFHFFAESVIFGARTSEVMEDFLSRGLISEAFTYAIYGDAAGKNSDTRSTRSDYDIIRQILQNNRIKFTYNVPPANPPVRSRHNKVNSYCKNALGQVRFFIHKGCKTADEGMRLTKLKKGGSYIEDDSKHYQHITTAIGYAVFYIDLQTSKKPQGSVEF
jgi:hypothetical protein